MEIGCPSWASVEMPSSPLVKMCLIRLLQILQLRRATQASFAEYHSKQNFVERVHAAENEVLSKHGPFDEKAPSPCKTMVFRAQRKL